MEALGALWEPCGSIGSLESLVALCGSREGACVRAGIYTVLLPWQGRRLCQPVSPSPHTLSTPPAPASAVACTCLQIETVQLSSECAIKTLEAELAGTKSSLAGFEAAFKADKASWGAELEGAKYEVRVLATRLRCPPLY